MHSIPNYTLLDSGDGERLERFGSTTLVRPSSLALWRKARPKELWQQAQAHYVPKSGWKFNAKPFESWQLDLNLFKLELRLQKNGQVGFFPDHALYWTHLDSAFKRAAQAMKTPRVLNLFAYTGFASTFFGQAGAAVCHVDLSEQALGWAKRNFEINKLRDLRVIADDALKFADREVKRGSKYEIIISDPPSFGRISKTKSWKIEEVIHSHLKSLFALLADNGTLFFSCHDSSLDAVVLSNLIRDFAPKNSEIKGLSLNIPEEQGLRLMPAGQIVICS